MLFKIGLHFCIETSTHERITLFTVSIFIFILSLIVLMFTNFL